MPRFEDYRQHIDSLFSAAIAAAEPGAAVRRYIQRSDPVLKLGDVEFDLDSGRVFVVSVGKAAVPMAEAAVDVLGDAVYAAGVISKKGSGVAGNALLQAHPGVRVMEGSHPVSGEDSVQATKTIIDQLGETTENDLVLCLISGGASALLTQPLVPLAEWRALIKALLASGSTINEINTVRRQLDSVKGGGLAELAAPAQTVTLVLSDVVGNPLEVIGSGPTVSIAESPDLAIEILERYQIAKEIGLPAYDLIHHALERSAATGPLAVPGDIRVVADVESAAEAARVRAQELGFYAQLLTTHLEGEAREAGRFAAALAKDAAPDTCLILGGETTVTMRGDGEGGRNQEAVLAAAIALADWPLTAVASITTDGEDGSTSAAGAAAAGWTAPFASQHQLSPQEYLNNHDSHGFFAGVDTLTGGIEHPNCLVTTGSTGTNVNDLMFILTYDAGAD